MEGPPPGVAVITKEPTATVVRLMGPAVPPPGEGVVTVTWLVPELATLPDGTTALSWVGEMKPVASAVPFRLTMDLATKFAPATVIVVSGDPVARTEGESELNDGWGLFTVKLAELDCPPPGAGLLTTMAKFPAVA